jgi:arginyl-tRNA synthetase
LSSHLEIDVAKAKTQNNDNPIYYVQYAHARINQLIHKAKELFQHLHKPKSFKFLVTQEESDLANMILYFKHTIELIANRYEANKMTIYLTSLARLFHSYYGNTKILDSKNERTSLERLFLVIAVQQVIKNGLKIIGIKAIESM